MNGRIVVIAMLSLIWVSSVVNASIVAFGGDYQRNYHLNPNKTNKITVSFTNVVYRGNSTIQWKILPTADNDFYIDSEGHQNYSWSAYITIKDGKEILLSQVLIDTRLTEPLLAENGKRYYVEIEITAPKNIQNGNYSVMFMALSKEYYNESQAINSTKGVGVGAKITESLAIQLGIIVENRPIPENKADSLLLAIGIISILVVTINIIRVIIRKRKLST